MPSTKEGREGMSEERNAVRFRQAAALLPPHLRRPVERLDGTSQARAEELRLRAGRPLTLVCPEGERTVPGAEAPVRSMDLSLVLEIATQASAHTALERVRNGFLPYAAGTASASVEAAWCGMGRCEICGSSPRWPSGWPGRCRGSPRRSWTGCGVGACSRAHCSSRRREAERPPCCGI